MTCTYVTLTWSTVSAVACGSSIGVAALASPFFFMSSLGIPFVESVVIRGRQRLLGLSHRGQSGGQYRTRNVEKMRFILRCFSTIQAELRCPPWPFEPRESGGSDRLS